MRHEIGRSPTTRGRFCRRGALVVLLILVATVAPALGQSDEDLAKQTQNPVADLISLPFQNNTTFGIGPEDRAQNVLNIQPVIPFNLSKDWNLISRTIVPLVWQPDPSGRGDGAFGISDIQETLFLAPAGSGSLIWGVGPIFQLPTSSTLSVGPRKFGLGPSVVGLAVLGPWVVGALANNVWSLAGDSDSPDVNQFLLQPFVNYNFGKTGWYAVSAPIVTANWEAPGRDVWTAPIGAGAGKVFTLGKQPFNVSAQLFYNAARPESSGDISLRMQVQLLFPKG